VSERNHDQIEEPAPKAEWTPPEVDRLVAGGAEGSAHVSADGFDNPS
jgi:hypothetical protein